MPLIPDTLNLSWNQRSQWSDWHSLPRSFPESGSLSGCWSRSLRVKPYSSMSLGDKSCPFCRVWANIPVTRRKVRRVKHLRYAFVSTAESETGATKSCLYSHFLPGCGARTHQQRVLKAYFMSLLVIIEGARSYLSLTIPSTWVKCV